ncbi:MAG TPA: hypothetical protein VKV20_12705 [Ktedonobacteraceae bacterium]|jgi:hypothetical protein|nr:hypothetical protein [Ktedonobacteraceae bacterium]
MARGSSYGDKPPLTPLSFPVDVPITRRATRVLPEVQPQKEKVTQVLPAKRKSTRAVVYKEPHPLLRHRSWLTPFILCMVIVVLGSFVLISAAIFQRHDNQNLVTYNGQSFPIQVGGSISAFNTWQNSTGPIATRTPIPIKVSTGPYSVLGKPTISAAFINQVLAAYGSPAAGTGQQMYDLGVKYGIDPVYALAFFMHESLFGTTGEARVTLSLGNMRCIPSRPCDQTGDGGYAQMYSWVDGYEQWYKLIRNLYVAQWGLVTVDQIIPTYAPSSDHNDVAGYIAALKHEVDTWRAGILRP